MTEYLYFDKTIKGPDDLNRTLMFGEGAFETFRYKQELPVFISRHLARLKNTSKLLGIKFPGDIYVETMIEKFVQEHKSDHFNNVIKDLIVKVLLFSSGGAAYSDPSDTTILCVSIKEDDSQRKQTNSLTIGKSRVSSTDIFNAHKTTNYLRSSIERRLAVASGFDDAVLVNEKNMVVETTAGNFFWIKGRNVFTPALSTGALNGIIRGLILEVCKKNKIRVLEGEYEVGSIIFPEAMFITNSARGIVEVLNLNDTTKPTRTQKLFPIIKKDLLELLGWT